MREDELIEGYKRDFSLRTGRILKVSVCSRWEAACQLPVAMSVSTVTTMILDANNWSWESVFNVSRKTEFLFRRGVIYYILYKCGFPFLQIARFTARDHTTIIHAIRQFENQLAQEPLTGPILIEVMDYINKNYTIYQEVEE